MKYIFADGGNVARNGCKTAIFACRKFLFTVSYCSAQGIDCVGDSGGVFFLKQIVGLKYVLFVHTIIDQSFMKPVLDSILGIISNQTPHSILKVYFLTFPSCF